MNKLPTIDLLSFFFGAILSLLFVFIVYQIKKLRPKLQSTLKGHKQEKSKDTTTTTDLLLRKYLLRKAQSSHVASSLFSLNEVYVDLKFISRPYFINPYKPLDDEPAAYTITSYFSDFPEIATELPVPLISLEESLSAGQNICVIGEIGSGKTTALAFLTSQILEKKCELQALNNLLPLFFHIKELQAEDKIEVNVTNLFCNTIVSQRPELKVEVLQELINNYLINKQVIFLIDGLDEIPSDQVTKSISLISGIHNQFPDLPIVTTLGPWSSFDLPKYNFSFVTVQYPGQTIRSSLLSKWKIAWDKMQKSEASTDIPERNELITLWSSQENILTSLFDYTLLCWSYCALDSRVDKLNPVSAYLARVTRDQLSVSTLMQIAKSIAMSGFYGISFEKLENIIKQDSLFKHVQTTAKPLVDAGSQQIESSSPLIGTNYNEKTLIKELVEINLLTEPSPGIFSFSNPSIIAGLAALDESYPKNVEWKSLLHSPLEDSISRRSKEFHYLERWINDSDGVLMRNMSLTIKHCANKPIDPGFQTKLYQNVVSQIQKLSIPFAQKFKLLSIFILRNDPTLPQLLSYFEKSGRKDLIQLSVFAFGYQKDQSRINFLIDCINGSDQSLHLLCILALYRNWNKQSKEIFAELLANGSENQQKVVAELLSQKDPEGHRMLEEYATNKNLLCRKAVTQGLRLISSEWATGLLEKMSTVDKEWFVRDAAVHALQNRWTNALYIPQQLVNPLEAPWLINYSSRTGQSLPEGEYPYGFFYQLLNEGTLEEKLTSLGYLTAKPDNDTRNILTNISLNNSTISEEAFQSLLQISKTIID